MDISWSSALAVICVHTHFAFLVSAFFCSLTLWGFTVSLVQLASLLLCNLTALERTVICKYNCTSRWYSQVALCMSVYLSFKSHTGMQLRCVHYFYVQQLCSIGKSTWTKTTVPTVSLTYWVHLSRIHLTRSFAVISCWKILQLYKEWVRCVESHPAGHGYLAIRHIVLLEVQLSREFNV